MRWTRNGGRGPAAVLILSLIFFLSLRWAGFGQTVPPQAPVTNSANQTPVAQAPPPLLIMIDAAHGGSESGAVLSPSLLEKDVTLSIARKLRQELVSRGMAAQLVRNADVTIFADQRAVLVNTAHPALYLSIHASSQGKEMRLYTSLLSADNGSGDSGPFIDWQSAQAHELGRSRRIESQVFASIQKTGFPVRALMAPLRPLNNITAPALAIEIAPTMADVSQLAAADYQQMISAALGNSIASIRSSLQAGTAP